MISDTTKITTIATLVALAAVAALAWFVVVGATAQPVTQETTNASLDDAGEIVVEVELNASADAANATVELYDDNSTLVESRNLTGSTGDWVTERFDVNAGNYTVDVLADSSTDIADLGVSTNPNTSDDGAAVASGGDDDGIPRPALGIGLAAVLAAAVLSLKEATDDY